VAGGAYAAVHARPDGESTVARFAKTAAEYGFEGLVVRNHGDAPASYDPAEIGETYDVDVVTGVEVRTADPSTASGYVGNHRPDHELVAVHGGDETMNRFAVEHAPVDVLAHPMAGDGDVNHVLAKAARTNGVRLEVSLAPILRDAGGSRVRSIADLRKLAELIDQFDAPYVVSADPESHLELRAPREVAALGAVCGLDESWVMDGLAEWGRLAARNRTRTAERFVEPGVRFDENDIPDG
jgi:ribonuclease P/MRP protein subunit RPP1